MAQEISPTQHTLIFLRALDYHALIKRETLQANENSFISKAYLRKSCHVLEWKTCIWKMKLNWSYKSS